MLFHFFQYPFHHIVISLWLANFACGLPITILTRDVPCFDCMVRRQFMGSPTQSDELSAPIIFLIVACFILGIFLTTLSQKYGTVTVGIACGMTLAILAFVAVMNAIPPRPPLPSNFQDPQFQPPPDFPRPAAWLPAFANVLTTVMVTVSLLLGICLSVFRFSGGYGRILGMGLMACLGGMSFGLFFVFTRRDFLIPKYFVNWIFVAFWAIFSCSILWRKPKIAMIVSPISVGVFLFAIAVDTIINKSQGIIMGLGSFFNHNRDSFSSQHTYEPSRSSILISGISPVAIPLLSLFHYYLAPESFQNGWPLKQSSPEQKKGRKRMSIFTAAPLRYQRTSERLFQNARSFGNLERSAVDLPIRDATPPPSPPSVQVKQPIAFPIMPIRPRPSLQAKVLKEKISLPTTYIPRSRFSQDSMSLQP